MSGPISLPTMAPPNRALTVGLAQMSCGKDPDANLKKAVQQVEDAASRGAQIVCLQELFRSPYFCAEEDAANFSLAEPVPGPTTEALAEVAAAEEVVIIAPVFEERAPGLYHNTAAVLDADGSLLGLYRKMHIPDDPAYFEKYYFAPGDLGFRAFDTRYGRIASLICWDQWFPEGARLAALAGAEVLFYPTAIGWHPHEREEFGDKQRDAWRTIQRAHAIANGMYVAVPNRVGKESRVEFWGGSFIADPFGEVIAEASQDKDEVLVATLDLDMIRETRHGWPFLRDRRIDAYQDILKRWNA